jgi:hypothetical protein
MPLIAPQRRQDRQPITFKADVRLATLLKHYAEFIASSPDYILNQALLVAFANDPEFHRWLGRTHPEDAGRIQELAHEQPLAASRGRLRRRGVTGGLSPSGGSGTDRAAVGQSGK